MAAAVVAAGYALKVLQKERVMLDLSLSVSSGKKGKVDDPKAE
jgi:hypothetical protein